MKAMILAAGEGQRMRPLTSTTPKPLLQVGGKSLLQHQIERLAEAGFRQLVINISYLGNQIEAAFGSGEHLGVSIVYSHEEQPLETAGGIDRALPLLGDAPFLLVNGDVWSEFPLAPLRQCLPPAAGAHLVLVPNPEHHRGGDFALAPDGRVQIAQDSDAAEHTATFSGISVIDPAMVQRYPHRRSKYPLREVLAAAIQRNAVTGERYSGYWLDVGTPERLHQLEQHLL